MILPASRIDPAIAALPELVLRFANPEDARTFGALQRMGVGFAGPVTDDSGRHEFDGMAKVHTIITRGREFDAQFGGSFEAEVRLVIFPR